MAKKKPKSTIEYSVIGEGSEEHFEDYDAAEQYCLDLGDEQQMEVQFFSKEWNWDGNEYVEGEVVIIKNYGEHL